MEVDAFEDELTFVEVSHASYEAKIGNDEGEPITLPEDVFMVSEEDLDDPELSLGSEYSPDQFDDV